MRCLRQLLSVLAGLSLLVIPAVASASNTPNLTQTINAGTLTTNIYQSDDATPVSSPAVAFTAKNLAFTCQTSTGTLGDTNNKVNVTNLAAGINTWTLSIAATSGFTGTWSDGTHTYKFNDATGTGCTNGQLTVDPSAATLTDDCSSACNDTNVTKGSSTAFNHGTSTDSVTLMSDSTGTAWEGYLTGINLSQKIPASQPSGSYSLGMTITVTNT